MKSASLLSALVASAISAAPALAATFTEPSQISGKTFDFIIVGAGNAGLVVANRLTENPGTTVLVLEAGVSDQGVIPVMAPFLGPSVTPDTPWDWNLTTVAQPGLNNRSYPYPRGRLLGGSSSANYMIHQYGTNEDWNRMASVSQDHGWSWNNMKQYIKRHEKIVPPSDGHNTTDQFIPSLHSFTGELPISLPIGNQTTDPFVIATTNELTEFPYNEDMSGINNNILGIGWAQSSMDAGLRASSSTSYLAAANDRPNLTVMINAMVTKLLPTESFRGFKSFRNVQFADARTKSVTPVFHVQARKEVILSAGSVGTPQILQLSGIGAPADLAPLNIPVQINSPQVGKNLQDHPLLPNIFNVRGNGSLDDTLRSASAVSAAIGQWAANKTGFIANNVINNLGFARLNSTQLQGFTDPSAGPTSPHFEMIFANFWLDPVITIPSTGNFLTILTALLTPTSRGTITIHSTNPFVAPLIDPNMLSTDFDIHTITESVKAVKRFAAAPAWSNYVASPFGTLNGTTDAELAEHARLHTTTVFHPTSTASITATSKSVNSGVVNADLTVKGAVGLRIVDLSVLPFIPSCHPQGPAYMLAERASDLIKAAHS